MVDDHGAGGPLEGVDQGAEAVQGAGVEADEQVGVAWHLVGRDEPVQPGQEAVVAGDHERVAVLYGGLDDVYPTFGTRIIRTPTMLRPHQVAVAAFDVGLEFPPGKKRWIDWTPFSFPFNLTQQPAASIPCGLTKAGLPVGLHIVGPKYNDALVLRAARAFETARPIVLPKL